MKLLNRKKSKSNTLTVNYGRLWVGGDFFFSYFCEKKNGEIQARNSVQYFIVEIFKNARNFVEFRNCVFLESDPFRL